MSLTTLSRMSAAASVLLLLVSAGAAAQPYPAPLRFPYTVPLPDDNVPPPQAYPAPQAHSAQRAYPAPPAEQHAEPATGASGTTSPLHAVSLRAGPSGASPVIGTLKQGTPVEILATASPGWLQVRSATGEGWAWGAFFPGGAGTTASVTATTTAHSTGTLRSEIISP
jgi:hypothetical protein